MRRPDFQTIVSSLEDLCVKEKEAQKARARNASAAGYSAFSPGSFGGYQAYGYGITPPTPSFGPYGPSSQGGLLPPRYGNGGTTNNGNGHGHSSANGSAEHAVTGSNLHARGGPGGSRSGSSQSQGPSRHSPFGGPLAGWRNGRCS